MSDNIYSKFNVDVTKLTRDYLKYPLQRKEKINKDDLYYLYITCHLSTVIIGKYFLNIDKRRVYDYISKYNIKKTRIQIELDRKYTNKIIYGVENVMQIDSIKKKEQESMIKKYGVNCPTKNSNIKIKQKQTCLEKYGVENVMQIDSVKNKCKQTCLKKYGTENFSQSENYKKRKDEIFNKQIQTKIKKGTLGFKSKSEDIIFDKLKLKYNTVLRNHKSNIYPFMCDFYIPKLNLYIEYQGTWFHGSPKYNCHCPYDPSNPLHKEVVNIMKNKNTSGYDNAINIWTISDPLKRKIAKENNLNWLEFFTMEEFMDWYNKL